jgi:hypothetical protein
VRDEGAKPKPLPSLFHYLDAALINDKGGKVLLRMGDDIEIETSVLNDLVINRNIKKTILFT